VNRLVNNRWVIENTIVSGIRSAAYYSIPKHSVHLLFPVLGAFVDAIGENRRCWYLYRLASLLPHGLVTICLSVLGTRRRHRALRHCLSVSTCFSAATRTGDDLFVSLRHSSSQSGTPSLLVFVSTCFSAATRIGNDLLESMRHSSSQSGTPSLLVFVSTSTRSHLPARVIAGSWGYSSPQSATLLLSEFINTSSKPHFSV
jgi:hypothetical protein